MTAPGPSLRAVDTRLPLQYFLTTLMSQAAKKEFNRLIASAKNPAEVAELFHTLLTPAEYEEFSNRWQIIKLLQEGSTQRDVRDRLKVSIATVTRGARELKYGSGILQRFYKRLLKR